jgi:hypothetical protein
MRSPPVFWLKLLIKYLAVKYVADGAVPPVICPPGMRSAVIEERATCQ